MQPCRVTVAAGFHEPPQCPSGPVALGVGGWELVPRQRLGEKQQGQRADSAMATSVATRVSVPGTAVLCNSGSGSFGWAGGSHGLEHGCSRGTPWGRRLLEIHSPHAAAPCHEVLGVILKALPTRHFSGLELLSCQWECKGQAPEPFVAVPLVGEQSPVPLSLNPDSGRGKA